VTRRVVAAALMLFVLAGCARRPVIRTTAAPPPPARPDVYAVLPASDGTVGAIVAVHGADRHVLDDAYAAVRVTGDGRLERGRITPLEVRATFGRALDTLPPPATSFTVYFVFGTDQLTPESSGTLNDLMTELQRRADPEVSIIGHTDAVGTVAQNDVLSLQRAERVRQVLLGLGIAADRMEAVGRGEREPLVPTTDEVAEPRNRRVEITVR
jgi:outer membrane protein OmpA-like peptidoglycan-associated protein